MIERLVAIMARLRDPTRGCEWDIEQDFASIAPYTIEEAYEVADAIARGDLADLRDELGDLLLQVVFHARIAEEAGAFGLSDVVTSISEKMERRHPHIFGDRADGGHHLWEQIKAEERAAKPDASAIAGVALGLPALLRAEKLQKRAARIGFDWPDPRGPRAKIDEELAEVEAAATPAAVVDEIGDLLFSVVNWARKLGVDPEAALRGANAKFERRFRAMEAADARFASADLDAKEALWRAAKATESRTGQTGRSVRHDFSRPALEQSGFVGWTRFDALRHADCPRVGGIYIVVQPAGAGATFAETNSGGWFKGRDPTVSPDVLAANWVPGAEIVYIGKADDLRRRLVQFADFGAGKPVGHWGGRLIWQLPDDALLKVAWKETPGCDPAVAERELINAFRAAYGKPPFANDPQRLGR